jgi:hypothetical protein
MKKASLNPAALGSFFLNHGEKLAFATVGAFSLLLAWWGVEAVRSQSVKPDRKPEAVSNLAGQAAANIDSVRKVPNERLPSRQPLQPVIDPWRPGQVKIAAAPAARTLLNRPLVAELSKRTKPDVFPIEDLRAVAGIAVLPDPNARAGDAEPGPRQPDLAPQEDDRRRKPRSKPKGRQQPDDGSAFGLEGGPAPDPNVAAAPRQAGKITPFVIVTGLIPAAKQQQEYERRFGSASFRDPRRDSPKWGVYLVERARVVDGGAPRWERLEVKSATQPQPGRIAAGEMGGGPGEVQQPLDQETLPRAFFLAAEESEAVYAAPLPQRIDEPWGAAGVHPWFLDRIEEFSGDPGRQGAPDAGDLAETTLADLLEDARKLAGKEFRLATVSLDAEPRLQKNVGLYKVGVRSAKPAAEVPVGEIGMTADPVFAVSEQWGKQLSLDGITAEPRACNLRCRVDLVGKTPVVRILELELVDDAGKRIDAPRTEPAPQRVVAGEGMAPAGMPPGGEQGGLVAGADNRLFRFIDTTVKPGETYRYRVKFALRNPNVDLAARHLADVAAAKGDFLVSELSNETPSVRVPEPVTLVARTIDKDTKRKLKVKGEAVEVMILAPSEQTGNLALRSTLTDIGGLANVTPELNRAGDVRFFGEPVTTDRLLVAAHGPQDDRSDIRSTEPPEPLEMLFLRTDGSFDVVTAADAERQVRRYGDTLFKPGTQVPDDGRPERRDREDLPPGGGGVF